MALDAVSMSPIIGSIVHGLDLSRDMSDEVMRELVDLLFDRGVVVIPGQSLGDADYVRFARYFGSPLEFFIPEHRNPDHPEIIHINNDPRTPPQLRDGAVHTDFRTDSPALRDALAKEWQAVAASSPGHLQHFLDPVFSPASVSSSTDAGTQQQASYRQSPQQHAQEQAANRQDAWHSQSPFSRRSALSESFVPEPAAPRVPVLLPTSLRLSVLA